MLFVGFQAEGTLGRRIQDGAKTVKIFGDPYDVRAEIETIGGYSAHADRTELRAWIRAVGGPIRRAFCVHGEPVPRRDHGGHPARGGSAGGPRAGDGQSFELT